MDFSINNTETNSDILTEYFTILGQHERLDLDDNPILIKNTQEALAKKTIAQPNNKTKYWIKIGAHGRIYNPMGLFSEGKSNKYMERYGKSEWRFRQVNKKVFDMYISFLRTKNIAWLHNAERQFI